MIKLAYIVNRIDGPGGLERVLSVKASELAENYNYEVSVITLNQDTSALFYEFSPKIKFYNVKAVGGAFNSFFQFVKGYKKVITAVNPDVISVCDDGLKGFLQPFFLKKPCPMIYERHVSIEATIKPSTCFKEKLINSIKNFFIRVGAKKYNRFVVLTKGNLNEWNFNNLLVIPNPLSFYPEASQKSNLENLKVLAVGKQSYQKGYDRLLKSWKLVIEKHPNWMLDIYGSFDKKQDLKQLAVDLRISESINFHKPTKQIAAKYAEASIYVMSSRYEGFGMVLIEAMAYGVPCISFDCPYGPSDIIQEDEDGYLVANGDTLAFAEKINTLIEDNSRRKKMGANAYKNVQRYHVKPIALQWDSLFKTLTSSTS